MNTGELEAELPNKNLYDFTGNLTQDGKETQPIGPNEVGTKTDFCSKFGKFDSSWEIWEI